MKTKQILIIVEGKTEEKMQYALNEVLTLLENGHYEAQGKCADSSFKFSTTEK